MRGLDKGQQRLLEIIDRVYAGDDRDQMLTAILGQLRGLFSFSSGVLLPIDPVTLGGQGAFSFDSPPEGSLGYLDHYAAFDPYVRRPPSTVPINRTVRFSDVAGSAEIDRSEFADFMLKVPYRHALAAVVGVNGQPVAAFSVHRPKGKRDFGAGEMAIFDFIAPHLGRALALRGRATQPAASVGVGLLVIGANGEALLMNTTAQRLLPAASVARVLAALPPGPGRLRLGLHNYRVSRLPWREVSVLTRLVLHECSPLTAESDILLRDSNDCAVAFCAAARSRDDRLTIVRLDPFRRRADTRRRLAYYRLSPREIETTEISLCNGLSNGQLAQRMCISEETVRTHLREAYRKIGVSSRLELLATILGLDDEPAGVTPGRALGAAG